MTAARKTVLTAGCALFGVWMISNVGRVTADDDGLIRFVLGGLLSILILLRWKGKGLDQRPGWLPGWALPVIAAAGAGMTVLGIIIPVHQFEWLGLILLLFACLRWALPPRFRTDLLLALLLLYWVHPLPGQIFGSFQLGMQWLSTNISEWVLQALNVRVWADGMVLHTDVNTFGVPESCSGMRTAVTVFLTTLGVGILLRLRWYEVVVFVVLGIVQVLALNVVRIVSMVIYAPRMPVGWAESFLHDTLGFFLFLAIVLIQVEMSVTKLVLGRRRRIKRGVRSGELEPPDLGTVLPGFWRGVIRYGGIALGLLLVAGGVAATVYKVRPSHRLEMIKGVLPGLGRRNPALGEVLARQILARDPGDRDAKSSLARILLERGKHQEALAALGELPGALDTVEQVWKSWALMALDRAEEAMAVIRGLPARTRRIPDVAIIQAEYAARRDDPATVAENVVRAAEWRPLSGRVRALFPYLAAREQWQAIADCRSDVPFQKLGYAVLAVTAHMRTGDVAGASAALRIALRQWPEEKVLLPFLNWAALNQPAGGWEEPLQRNFLANLQTLTAPALADYIESSFRRERPDQAWLAFHRLDQIDPRDPALSLALARYGPAWMRVSTEHTEVLPSAENGRIDLSPLRDLTRYTKPLAGFWERVPHSDEMPLAARPEARRPHLKACIEELERRERERTPSFRMAAMRPFVLALMGRYDDAHAALDRLAERFPERHETVLRSHALLYREEERWDEAYEALRDYELLGPDPSLEMTVMRANALMNLNGGVAALEVLRRARDSFPGAKELDLAEAAVWSAFGFHARALFLLERHAGALESAGAVRLLYNTGRYEEAEQRARRLGMEIPVRRGGRMDRMPPRAEQAVTNRWPEPLDAAAMAEREADWAVRAEETASPFIRRLAQRLQQFFAAGCVPDRWETAAFAAIGRDPLERATALHHYAVACARQEHVSAARQAVSAALAELPRSPVLHRMAIILCEGEPAVVAAAAEACPEDGEIWLATLVTAVRADPVPTNAIAASIDAVLSGRRYPVEQVLRAGDLLLRRGYAATAERVAGYGLRHGEDLLASYALALRCALQQRKWQEAARMAVAATERAVEPAPYFRLLAEVKTVQRRRDGELVDALEFLRGRFPDETRWPEQLGHVHFQDRQMRRAWSVLAPVLSSSIAKIRPQSIVVAAEAARQTEEWERTVEILRTAYGLYPEDLRILNNLVYCLAMKEETLPQARRLLPKLLELDSDNFAVLDTIATVYLKSGDLSQAQQYMERAMERLGEDDYAALETRLNAARVGFETGNLEESRDALQRIRRAAKDNRVVERAATELLQRIERAMREEALR